MVVLLEAVRPLVIEVTEQFVGRVIAQLAGLREAEEDSVVAVLEQLGKTVLLFVSQIVVRVLEYFVFMERSNSIEIEGTGIEAFHTFVDEAFVFLGQRQYA